MRKWITSNYLVTIILIVSCKEKSVICEDEKYETIQITDNYTEKPHLFINHLNLDKDGRKKSSNSFINMYQRKNTEKPASRLGYIILFLLRNSLQKDNTKFDIDGTTYQLRKSLFNRQQLKGYKRNEFRSWGGKRNLENFTPWGGKRNVEKPFTPWGGKRRDFPMPENPKTIYMRFKRNKDSSLTNRKLNRRYKQLNNIIPTAPYTNSQNRSKHKFNPWAGKRSKYRL